MLNRHHTVPVPVILSANSQEFCESHGCLKTMSRAARDTDFLDLQFYRGTWSKSKVGIQRKSQNSKAQHLRHLLVWHF